MDWVHQNHITQTSEPKILSEIKKKIHKDDETNSLRHSNYIGICTFSSKFMNKPIELKENRQDYN